MFTYLSWALVQASTLQPMLSLALTSTCLARCVVLNGAWYGRWWDNRPAEANFQLFLRNIVVMPFVTCKQNLINNHVSDI